MTDTPSFQDLLNDFADEVFVGRSEQLSLFESAIMATKPSFLILNISGQGGVGKSTLLERYRGISKSNDGAYAIVNEDHLTIPKILETFVEQLERDELDFGHFNERYRKYQELKEKVESDPKVPTGLMDLAVRGIAKVGVKSLKRIPVAGDVADVFLSPESEEVIADQASEFTKYIFQKFTNKDERVLLLETDSELTKYFLGDLTKALKTRKAVLSFDTYEKTSEGIEKWLIDLLLGEFGQFSSNVLFVIAGRYALGQNWTRFRKAIRQVELKEFTDEEAKDYLTRSGITDEKLLSQFIQISERLPVLLALLVSSPNQLPRDVSGDAVQRFLQGLTSEQREAALISSLPRYFNSDILVSILGGEAGKRAFEWLSQAHFVRTSENGWAYHDVVRLMMLRYFRMRSNQQYATAHKHLEEYYEKLTFGSGVNKEKATVESSKLEEERIYHFLCQNPSKNIEYVAKFLFADIWKTLRGLEPSLLLDQSTNESLNLLKTGYLNAISQLVEETSDSMIKEVSDRYQNLIRFLADKFTEDNPLIFNWLNNLEILDEKERNALLIFSGISKISSKKEERLKEALNDFGKLIQLQSCLEMSHWLRGYTFNQLKDYPAAVMDFSVVIDLQPENGDNYYWRGRTYYQMEDYSTALLDFSKAIELQPENRNNFLWRGVTYYQMEDYLTALADFSKAIELQPGNGNNYYWRGRTYYQMEDYLTALADFSKAIELQPEIGNYYYGRGISYYQMEDYLTALADFSKAIELQPGNGNNYRWRGRTYYHIKNYPVALIDFSKAVALQPENGNNYYRCGTAYYGMKDYAAALTKFSKAIALQPEDGDIYLWQGATYYQIKDYPAALIYFSKAVALQPESAHNCNWRGRTYYQMKDYSTALLDFSKAIELQPENGVNYYRRALCHLALGNKENYYDDVKTALHLINTKYEQNKESDIAFMIALCSLASGEADKAQRLYEETISQCFDKNDLSNALKNLEEFTDLLGKTEKTEFVVKSLNEASAKLS